MSRPEVQPKFGEIHSQAMLRLGLVELRGAFQFDQSNIQSDVLQCMYDARRDVEQSHQNAQAPVQQPEQTHELELGRSP